VEETSRKEVDAMSKEAVEKVVGKAVLDSEFREALFADPDKVLAAYDLTEDEVAALKAIDFETMESFAGTVDDRISKIGLFALTGTVAQLAGGGALPEAALPTAEMDAEFSGGREALPDAALPDAQMDAEFSGGREALPDAQMEGDAGPEPTRNPIIELIRNIFGIR
jgi:hypothetical protein